MQQLEQGGDEGQRNKAQLRAQDHPFPLLVGRTLALRQQVGLDPLHALDLDLHVVAGVLRRDRARQQQLAALQLFGRQRFARPACARANGCGGRCIDIDQASVGVRLVQVQGLPRRHGARKLEPQGTGLQAHAHLRGAGCKGLACQIFYVQLAAGVKVLRAFHLFLSLGWYARVCQHDKKQNTKNSDHKKGYHQSKLTKLLRIKNGKITALLFRSPL